MLKTYHSMFKTKDLDREKIIGFYKKRIVE